MYTAQLLILACVYYIYLIITCDKSVAGFGHLKNDMLVVFLAFTDDMRLSNYSFIGSSIYAIRESAATHQYKKSNL